MSQFHAEQRANTFLEFRYVLPAIQDGELEKVKTYFDKHRIRKCSNSYVLVRNALKFRHKEIVKFLLSIGARVNPIYVNSNFDPSALHLAVHFSDEEIMVLLLQKGASTEAVGGPEMSTPLCEAVRYVKVDMVRVLLNHGANVNLPGLDGKTPIQISIGKGNLHITEMLLNSGADLNSALFSAAEKGEVDIFKLLLSRDANINHKSRKTLCTPLHIAVEHHNDQLVDFLLKEGADVNAFNSDGKSVLGSAVETGSPVLVDMILSHRPDLKGRFNQMAVHTALQCQNDKMFVPHEHERRIYGDIIENLLSYGFTINDVDAMDRNYLFAAIREGHVKIVEELMKHLCNREALSNSILSELLPLYPSTLSNPQRLANVLVKYGADDNARYTMRMLPSKRALFRNMGVDWLKLLLTNRAAVRDTRGLLGLAVWYGHFEVVEYLVGHGADVNALDAGGLAALHCCVLPPMNALCPRSQRRRSSVKTDKDIIKKLVSSGADINIRTRMNESLLHIAAQNNLDEIVGILADLQADLNVTDYAGKTVLHYFAHNGNFKLSEYLLSKGADVNARSTDDLTPLHVASERGRLDMVQSLLENGADVDSNSKHGTPLHVACLEGRADVAKFLVEYGADVNIIAAGNSNIVEGTPIAYAGHLYIGESQNFLRSFFLHHLYKMKAAGLHLNAMNLCHIERGVTSAVAGLKSVFVEKNYLSLCEDEVTALKSMKIENSNFSCYDILVGCNDRLVKLCGNESLRKALNSSDFEQNFPLYSSLIKKRYQKGKWMRGLWDACSDVLYNICPNLPDLCIERILEHLSTSDMRQLKHTSLISNCCTTLDRREEFDSLTD